MDAFVQKYSIVESIVTLSKTYFVPNIIFYKKTKQKQVLITLFIKGLKIDSQKHTHLLFIMVQKRYKNAPIKTLSYLNQML